LLCKVHTSCPLPKLAGTGHKLLPGISTHSINSACKQLASCLESSTCNPVVPFSIRQDCASVWLPTTPSLVQVLIAGHGSNIQPGTLKAAVDEVAPLVNDTDLLIAALSLTFCTTLLQRQPQQSGLVTDRVLPAAMTLSKSPLLQVPVTTSQSAGSLQ